MTAPAVGAAAIARKWMREQYGLRIRGYLCQMGEIEIPFIDWSMVDSTPFFVPNTAIVPQLEDYLDGIRKDRDSVGAKVRVVAENVPIGLGEPLYDKLDADIAYAMMGINAVKGVEIGAGFGVVTQRGTTHGDEITRAGFQSNNAGGVLGGISSGQNIEVTIAIKPTSSIAAPKQSLDIDGNEVEVVTTGRHDPCVGIRATPIAEAMLALVLMDHALRHRAQCGEPKASGEVFKPR